MAKAKGQDAKRRRTFMKDQHGRKYFANIEIETGDPLDLTPHQWTAPKGPHWARGLFLPPIGDPDVVKVIPDYQRADAGCDVFIDYAKWEEKQQQRNQQRDEDLRQIIQGMAGTGADVIGTIERPSQKVQDFVGPEAFPPVEIIRAMRAENPWALGLTDVVPEKAQAILDRIEAHVKKARLIRVAVEEDVADPFADEEAEERAANFDALMDLEEAVDPLAEDGRHVVKVGGKRGRTAA